MIAAVEQSKGRLRGLGPARRVLLMGSAGENIWRMAADLRDGGKPSLNSGRRIKYPLFYDASCLIINGLRFRVTRFRLNTPPPIAVLRRGRGSRSAGLAAGADAFGLWENFCIGRLAN